MKKPKKPVYCNRCKLFPYGDLVFDPRAEHYICENCVNDLNYEQYVDELRTWEYEQHLEEERNNY